MAWIRSLVNRAKKLCSPGKLQHEIKNIKKFASYNGFPRWIAKNIIKQSLTRRNAHETEDTNKETLYMFLPYNGKEAENIVQRCKRRLQKLFKKEKYVKFDVSFQTTKISFYNNNKDTLPKLSNSNVIYEYTCPGCSKKYIGKTMGGSKRIVPSISTFRLVPTGITSETCSKSLAKTLMPCNFK